MSAGSWPPRGPTAPPGPPYRVTDDTQMMLAVADRTASDDDGYCNGCFTGKYPIHVGDAQAKLSFEGVLA